MCSTWIINGKRCETGHDLVAAVGLYSAERVNGLYDMMVGNVPRLLTAEDVAKSCLCHVDPDKMSKEIGDRWDYDANVDAFVREGLMD